MVKIKMTNYGATFNLHCPRCGNVEYSESVYSSGENLYRKCLHCGADVCTDTHTRVGIVVEAPFMEFTPQTYSIIEKTLSDDLKNGSWKMPEEDHADGQE